MVDGGSRGVPSIETLTYDYRCSIALFEKSHGQVVEAHDQKVVSSFPCMVVIRLLHWKMKQRLKTGHANNLMFLETT